MNKFLTLLLLTGTLPVTGWAQSPCAAHTLSERWLQAHGKHVDFAQEAARMEQLGLRGGGTMTVPVVVHVVWNTSAENVSDDVVLNIIDQLNDDYQAMNSDFDDVRPVFADNRANAQIEFCLATVDPSGNPTTGIERVQTTETWFDPDSEWNDMKFASDGSPAWNTQDYLNIWICDISSGATGGLVTTGYAYLPYDGMAGTPIDGLVLDKTYGTGFGDRTATHEVGHYLGLDHPWGNENCVPGDGIGDTPATDGPTFSCSNTTLMKCNTLTQYENFMDYSNCSMMFTTGQANVMSGVLNGIRSSLLSSDGCGGAGSSTVLCIPTSNSGTTDGDFIDGVVLGSINNTGSGSESGPAYNDYTTTGTTLVQGETYDVTITGGTYDQDHYAAWIDYNRDTIFSVSERLGEFTTTAPGESQTITFTVPANADLGASRLRVRGVFAFATDPMPPDPCYAYDYGETEDYGIVLSNASGIAEQAPFTLATRTFPDHLVVSWNRRATNATGFVMDASGRVVMAVAPTGHEAVIQTADLATGVYQLILHLDGARKYVRFVVAAH